MAREKRRRNKFGLSPKIFLEKFSLMIMYAFKHVLKQTNDVTFEDIKHYLSLENFIISENELTKIMIIGIRSGLFNTNNGKFKLNIENISSHKFKSCYNMIVKKNQKLNTENISLYKFKPCYNMIVKKNQTLKENYQSPKIEKENNVKYKYEIPSSNHQLEESMMEEAEVKELQLGKSMMEKSNLKESQLGESMMEKSNLKESHLGESMMEKSIVKESQLGEPMMEKSMMEESKLKESKIKESISQESMLEEKKLIRIVNDVNNTNTNELNISNFTKKPAIESRCDCHSKCITNHPPKNWAELKNVVIQKDFEVSLPKINAFTLNKIANDKKNTVGQTATSQRVVRKVELKNEEMFKFYRDQNNLEESKSNKIYNRKRYYKQQILEEPTYRGAGSSGELPKNLKYAYLTSSSNSPFPPRIYLKKNKANSKLINKILVRANRYKMKPTREYGSRAEASARYWCWRR